MQTQRMLFTIGAVNKSDVCSGTKLPETKCAVALILSYLVCSLSSAMQSFFEISEIPVENVTGRSFGA